MNRINLAILTLWLALAPACAQVGGLAFPGPGPVVASAPFSPSSLPGLIAWYKADNDGTNVFTDTGCTTPATNGSLIACWKDKSGNGYNCIMATSGNRPTYNTTGLNSKPTVVFTAASQTGCLTATGVAFGTGTTGSGFFIGTLTSSSGTFAEMALYCAPLSTSCNSAGDFITTFRNNGAASICSEWGATATGTCSAISVATETRMGGIANGSTITPYVNGVAGTGTAVSGNSVSAGCIVLGGQANGCALAPVGVVAWDGAVSEVTIGNAAWNSTQVANLDAYLVARW